MLIIALLLTCLMILIIQSDLRKYIIPNWITGCLLLLYPVAVVLSPVRPDWKIALLIALGMFAVGFVLFAARIMGGGDIKLLPVTALYAGKESFLDFIVGVALLGGILTLLLLALRPFTAYAFSRIKSPPPIPRVLTTGEPVPYGLAIAGCFLALLWAGKLPGIVF